MTDRYENIRKALAMGPTQGQRKWWEHEDLGYCSVNPVDGGLLIAKCDVRNPFDQEQRANAALIAACDPDTIRALLAEKDALVAALEEAQEDAERYRWLYGDACPDHSVRWTQWEVRCWRSPVWSYDLRRQELDQAIDDARAAEESYAKGYAADIAALLDRLDAADRENERLRAERDEHARWRVDLADKLHDAESQISAAWAALRRAGIQSEETVAEAIALLHAENDRLREDADRYRWLRGSADIPAHSTRWARWEVRRWDGRYWSTIFTEQVDAAIDAAMAAEQSDERREG